MANIKVNIKDLENFEKQLVNMQKEVKDQFIKQSTQLLAGEFLRKVKDRTPIGQYGNKVEFTTQDGEFVSFNASTQPTVGGTLRDGWKMGKLEKTNKGYEVEIYNKVDYAMFVENGHVIRNVKGGEAKGFVRGRFMLRNTEIEMVFTSPEILEKKLEHFVRKMLNE
jgi:hypothetical protein